MPPWEWVICFQFHVWYLQLPFHYEPTNKSVIFLDNNATLSSLPETDWVIQMIFVIAHWVFWVILFWVLLWVKQLLKGLFLVLFKMVFSLSNFFELLFWVILLFKVLFWVNVLFWVIFWGIFWVNLLFWALFWVTLFELDALLGTFTFLSTFKSPFFCHLLFWGLLKVLFFYFFRLKTFMLFITPSNYALEEERVGKYFHLTLCTDCDYLVHRNTFLKWKDIMFSFIKTS